MPRRVQSSDLLDLAFVSDPQLSAGGHVGAAVVTRIVRGTTNAAPRYRSEVLRVDLRAGTSAPFTSSEYGDTSPRFSPEADRLAFLRKPSETGKPQLHILPMAGGESRPYGHFEAGVSEICWHPDGRRLALVSRGAWRDEGAERGLPRRIARLHYKADGVGFVPQEPAQIHLLSLRSGHARRLTDLPVGASELAFSPDGSTLYFVSADDPDQDDAWRGGIYALELRTRQVRTVAGSLLDPSAPSPSPDGRHLAFLAPTLPEDVASPIGVWVVDAAGGKPRLLTGGSEAKGSPTGDSRYGAYPQRPLWDDDASVIFNLNKDGASGLARVALEGGVTPLMDGRRAVTAFAYAAGRALVTVERPDAPGELLLREPGSQERVVSAVNATWRERVRLKSPSETLTLRTRDGLDIGYWVLPPVRARRDRAVVIEVHGGPHANGGYGFSFEFQLLAARGYTVVYGNPRGGSSFGPDFRQAVLGDYGGRDASDVLAMVEHAMKRHSEPDAPVHLTGGSYGGFMTNWLVSHSNRFRSAVTQRSISNWLSFYGSADVGYRFTEREIGGNAWDDTERLWRQSPLKYVADVNTPLLVIHSEQDLRCPMEQGEQFYVALKRIGKVDTALLRFPEEGHELSRSGRPDRRVARLDAITDWFERHP
jgi:dipeptidyl aminopeptidase/acylaminoacyl peptidase